MNIKKIATALFEQGFSVIPTGANKAPLLNNWTEYQDKPIEPNGNFNNAAGCGVVTGQKIGDNYLAALDIDCYDANVSREMCNYIADTVKASMPYRVGETPKFLIPVLIDKKIKKQYSNEFIDSKGQKSRIEVLCDGQQFVAHGLHPKSPSGKYTWYNGDLSIDKLPQLTVDQVADILNKFNSVMSPITVTTAASVSSDYISGIDDLPLDNIDIKTAQQYLSHIPADIDHDTWNRVGMALHHQFQGDAIAFKLWDTWSKSAPDLYDGELNVIKWESYGNNEGTPIRFASVIALSKKYKQLAIEQVFEKDTQPVVSQQKFNQINDAVWANQKVQKWLVKGVLEQATVNAIYGPPKTGKSFIAIDMALHIAHGKDWCAKKVKPGPVCYIAGEGTLGVERRIAAWRLEHNITGPSDFYLSKQNFILTDAEQLTSLIESLDAIHAQSPLSMIVIDTYARALGGEVDENSTGETGKVIKILDNIKDRYKAAVTIVHHSPKGSGASLRGSGALQGALDSSMSVEKNKDNVVVTCRDQKDAGDFGQLGFKLIGYELPTELYIDNFDEGVSSAVAKYDPDYDAENEKKNANLSPSGEAIIRAFNDEFDLPKAIKASVPSDIILKYGLDATTEGLYIDDVKERFYRQEDGGEGGSTARGKWRRGLSDAKNKEYLEELDGIIFKL